MRQLHFDLLRLLDDDRRGSHASRRAFDAAGQDPVRLFETRPSADPMRCLALAAGRLASAVFNAGAAGAGLGTGESSRAETRRGVDGR